MENEQKLEVMDIFKEFVSFGREHLNYGKFKCKSLESDFKEFLIKYEFQE